MNFSRTKILARCRRLGAGKQRARRTSAGARLVGVIIIIMICICSSGEQPAAARQTRARDDMRRDSEKSPLASAKNNLPAPSQLGRCVAQRGSARRRRKPEKCAAPAANLQVARAPWEAVTCRSGSSSSRRPASQPDAQFVRPTVHNLAAADAADALWLRAHTIYQAHIDLRPRARISAVRSRGSQARRPAANQQAIVWPRRAPAQQEFNWPPERRAG